MAYQDYIVIDSEKRFGQPCVVNTRITVSDILSWIASGMTFDDIVSDFPQLRHEHIQAALEFAAEREHAYRIAS